MMVSLRLWVFRIFGFSNAVVATAVVARIVRSRIADRRGYTNGRLLLFFGVGQEDVSLDFRSA